MSKFLILGLFFFSAVLQGAFLPLNLVLLAVIFLAAYRSAKEVLLTAFIAGCFLDLAKGTPVGFSSFWLLVISFLLIVYRRRFDSRHPVFLIFITFLTSGLMNYLAVKNYGWDLAFILALIAFIFRSILKLFSLEAIDGIKLKV